LKCFIIELYFKARMQEVIKKKKTLTVLEVEPVEVHPLHQVAERLRLKGGQSGVADLPEAGGGGGTKETHVQKL